MATSARTATRRQRPTLLLALTGLTPLIELNVIEPQEALTAVDQHLDRLFASDAPAATDHS
jgi:hypothetical protein